MNFSPKVNFEVSFCLINHVLSYDQKLKMKKISELVANLLYLDKQMGISERR